ncbi:hypothetical protein SNE40_019055 [Patella caerulea]|uniref:Uncharacterized protein n=1 Tax=Patella caerulea TaxID=87958 RepID=A0AAN8J6E4_PATCE
MFKTVLLLLGLSGCCLAQRCCVPNTWEGIQRQTAGSIKDGKPTVSVTDIKVHYDLTNFRAAFDENVTANGYTVQVKVIQMFKDGTEYIISGNTCSKKMIPSTPQTRCLPDTAKLEGKHFIVDGKNNVSFNTYKDEAKGVSVYVSLTEHCKPVSQVIYGASNGVQFLSSDVFYDITDGIVDPAVFNIPAICSNAKLIPSGKTDPSYKGVLSR